MRAAFMALAGLMALPSIGMAQTHQEARQTHWAVKHRVVIQIDQDDTKAMNLALNNAANMKEYWTGKGEQSQIEFVALGPGLAMVRLDNSPVTARIFDLEKKGVRFSGCGNTKANQAKAENKDITFLSGVTEVPSGVARIVELEEQGWQYLRP